MTWRIILGNNLDVLPTLEDNSVDSIVTDPPYELGFMGKKWDSSGIAYSVELWQQCLRVLKPGGHLLSFGGTRTYHRVAVAIEDAGFELRDSIAWLYGSGFPKSMDISKAIDKSDATKLRRQRDLGFTAWMRSTGITAKQINDLTESAMGNHYLTDKEQPSVATEEMFSKLRPYLPEVPENIEKLVAERTVESENYKKREVISERPAYGIGSTGNTFGGHSEGAIAKETLPSTLEAQQWQGWGTALKPAFEPVIVARKPIEGTVANNVLKWGTGGLNIDGSRIGTDERTNNYAGRSVALTQERSDVAAGIFAGNGDGSTTVQGRWPANIILDPYTAELLDEQSGEVRLTSGMKKVGSFSFAPGEKTESAKLIQGKETKGGASRFFYVAKASKRDRNEGLDELEPKQTNTRTGDAHALMNPVATQPRQNFHPTVKPTSLMEYLIKLVTPPNGTVLDPFAGSGSTGKASVLEGFDFIGIELTEEYLPIIDARLKHAEKERKNKEGLF